MTQSEQSTLHSPQLNSSAQLPEASLPESSLSELQVHVWLRALLTLAWADGDFDKSEQQLVASITHHELTPKEREHLFEPLSVDELKAAFGEDTVLAENFLRTAVMVAISDGVYTHVEDELLAEFCQALGAKTDILDALRSTLVHGDLVSGKGGSNDTQSLQPSDSMVSQVRSGSSIGTPVPAVDPLQPVRVWLDGMEVQDPKVARFLCKLIPSQCPFERDVVLFGKKIVHIPPMCKLNPLYEQMVGLRFRALSYLADDCGEDISSYI